jgi:phage tail-like protein
MPLGLDPIASYNFFVSIDGITVAQFKECDGLSIQVKVIEHRSQQLKGLPILRKLPGSVVYEDIVLKRGKVNDDMFWRWILTVQNGDVDAARKTGTIMLFDYTRAIATQFQFRDGWPSMVEVGKLQSGSDTVLLETVKITHEELTVKGVTPL